MKRKESQNPLKTTYQHDESTPFGVLFYDLDSENMAACGHLLGLVPPLAPTGSSGLICRSPERGCLDCQRFPFPLSSRGWFVLSSMLDAEEQGAQRPEENTVMLRRSIPKYTSLYFASQSRSASTAFVRTKCGTHVLDGDTPYPVIRTKDSAY